MKKPNWILLYTVVFSIALASATVNAASVHLYLDHSIYTAGITLEGDDIFPDQPIYDSETLNPGFTSKFYFDYGAGRIDFDVQSATFRFQDFYGDGIYFGGYPGITLLMTGVEPVSGVDNNWSFRQSLDTVPGVPDKDVIVLSNTDTGEYYIDRYKPFVWVPIPAALPLFVSGVIVLVGFQKTINKRRRHKIQN